MPATLGSQRGMPAPELLKRVSIASKAMLIVNEFTHKLMDAHELAELLTHIETDPTKRSAVIQEVDRQLRAVRFTEGRITELTTALSAPGPSAPEPSTTISNENPDAGLSVTQRVRSPHLMPFEQFEFNAKPKTSTQPRTQEMSVGDIKAQVNKMQILKGNALPPTPLSATSNSAAKSGSQNCETPPASENAQGRIPILVADDDARARLIYRVKLEETGYVVVEAQDGVEAWDFIRGGAVKGAVLDMKMPGLHGLEIISRMVDANMLLPIVVVSAFDQLESEFVISTYPKLKYITKPAPPDEVAGAMLTFLTPKASQ